VLIEVTKRKNIMKQKQQPQRQVKPRNWTVIALKSGMFRSKTEPNRKRDSKSRELNWY
jgi:hypothetical protein